MWGLRTRALFMMGLLISALALAQQNNWKLKFYIEEIPNGYRLLADNEEFAPMSAAFQFTLNNMKTSLPDGKTVLIPAQTNRFVIGEITAADRRKSYRFAYNTTYNIGDVNQMSFDENYIYELPFEKGKSYRVDQGYNGTFSHQNQNSLDFRMPEGSKIFAAREGKVVDVVESNDTRCTTKDCAKFNNKIIILHPDGTLAEYVHLKLNGAEVNRGDDVAKGQFLGYSGNTGWSNGPHLHFSVFLNRMNGERLYIPTRFRTASGSAELLYEKKSYSKN